MFFKRVPEIAFQEIPKGAVLIDVREPFEFKQGHAPKAKNIPLGHIKSYQGKGPVYLICASGMRSKRAAKVLRRQGIEAFSVQGGMRHV